MRGRSPSCHHSTYSQQGAVIQQSSSQVFREVGRAVRTAVLLRYVSDPALREQIQKATNKAEGIVNLSTCVMHMPANLPGRHAENIPLREILLRIGAMDAGIPGMTASLFSS
ncbi:Tn3 family transposase [Streptomyces sp. NPDC005574]|uniref:Tn3 family transposase n=1 Tax=Streptomyces sp. NPDC005574 TaxID=3156891 RepID=UPI0033B37380